MDLVQPMGGFCSIYKERETKRKTEREGEKKRVTEREKEKIARKRKIERDIERE